jgi:hypothetical protein
MTEIHDEVIEMIESGDFDSEELAALHRAVLKARNLPYAGIEDLLYTDQIKESVSSGRLDSFLDEIYKTVQLRRTVKGGQKRAEQVFRRGVTVKATSPTLRPKYMIGHEFLVKKVNAKTVVIDIPDDDRFGRFSGQKNVRMPKSCVEVVA